MANIRCMAHRFPTGEITIERTGDKELPDALEGLSGNWCWCIAPKTDTAVVIHIGQRSMVEWQVGRKRLLRRRPYIVGLPHASKNQGRERKSDRLLWHRFAEQRHGVLRRGNPLDHPGSLRIDPPLLD